MIYDRRHTRLIAEFGGLAKVMPAYSALFFIVTLGSIALPAAGGFVGEFLVLVGTFTSAALPHARLFASLGALGMILSAVYMLWMYQRVIFGEIGNPANLKLSDLSLREWFVLVPAVVLIFVMGVYPSLFLSRSEPDIKAIGDAGLKPSSRLYSPQLNSRLRGGLPGRAAEEGKQQTSPLYIPVLNSTLEREWRGKGGARQQTTDNAQRTTDN